MGCDFSVLVKRQFSEKIAEIDEAKTRISEKKEQITEMMLKFHDMEMVKIDIPQISESISQDITKLQCFAEDLEQLKAGKTIDLSKELAEPNRISLKMHRQSKINLTESPAKSEKKGSILEDPEIAALINKNRNRLMKKPLVK